MTILTEATQLINDIGKAMTLRKVTTGSYDPTSGAINGTTTIDTAIKGMLLNYQDRQFDGDIIQRGDRKAVIRASDSVIPTNQDLLIAGPETLRIINVRQIEQAGTDLVYICQVRE